MKCLGKVRGKSGNFEVDDKWQPCTGMCHTVFLVFKHVQCIYTQILKNPCHMFKDMVRGANSVKKISSRAPIEEQSHETKILKQAQNC